MAQPPDRTSPQREDETPPTSVRSEQVRPRAPSPPQANVPRVPTSPLRAGATGPMRTGGSTAPTGGRAGGPATGQIHDFQLTRLLGRGGMAEVYLAERKDGRQAAVKLLLPQYAQDPEIVRRFMLEMKATASLRHPNVIEILDFGDAGGQYFLATEYMDGGSLRDLWVSAGHHLPTPAVESMAGMLLGALGAAHSRQIVHRDVKPANILLDSTGNAKLGDFGVARSLDVPGPTRTGLIMGTPAYMSPEQAAGEKLDGRSDLFALGIVLYELLAGANPFAGSNESGSLVKVLTADPPLLFQTNPAVPAPFELFIHRLLAKDRDHRFESAEAALAELGRFAPHAIDAPQDAVREVLSEPAGAYVRWATVEGQRHFTNAQSLLQMGPARRPQAILELFRAHLLAPNVTGAEQLLQELYNGRDPFAPPQNPKIAELEEELSRQPQSHALLMQLAAMYKLELDPVKAIGYYRRVLRLRPDDGYAIGQLRALLGDEADTLVPMHLTLQTQPPRPAPSSLSRPRTGAQPVVAATVAPPVTFQPVRRSPFAGKIVVLSLIAGVVLIVVAAVRAAGRFIDVSASSTREASEHIAGNLGTRDTPPNQVAINTAIQAHREKGEHLYDEAMQQLSDGDTDKAEESFKAFRDEYPKHPRAADATFQLAKIYTRFSQSSAARAELEPYIKEHPADPNIPEARLMLGKAERGMNDLDAALKELDSLVKDHPSSPVVTEALYVAGQAYEEKGDKATAQKRYEEVVSRTGPADELYVQASAALERLKAPATPP